MTMLRIDDVTPPKIANARPDNHVTMLAPALAMYLAMSYPASGVRDSHVNASHEPTVEPSRDDIEDQRPDQSRQERNDAKQHGHGDDDQETSQRRAARVVCGARRIVGHRALGTAR